MAVPTTAEQAYTDRHHGAGDAANGINRKPHQSMVSQVSDPPFFKVANPGPLGLISFALTTFVLGLYQCGAGLPGSNPMGDVGPDQAVFGLAVFLGGASQFIAGIMEFRVGNTFGTTAHCSYGAFWLAFAMFLVPSLGIKQAYHGDERAYSFALGIFLFLWFFLTLIFFMAALKTNIAILVVFGFLALTYLFLSIAQFVSTTHVTAAIRVNRAGGAFAILSALAAFYTGGSGLMTEDTTWVRFPLGQFSYTPKQPKATDAV
ncbi:Gpr1 family protein [Ophiocordyceps sinensis CO18]|uniref:Gpr1 family protein n=1 Tax=Ophiocordyceps sinensis (strain Co18 / CGMCC 3.14243) TaxID=911162 RepID=T5AD82_OPHSC|nr:Gpr1 family protein [Ophiocordyceps sinensis CO18]